MYGKMQEILGSLKSFLSYASQHSRVSTLSFSSPKSLSAHLASGCSLIIGTVILSECPEELESLMTVTSLLTDKAGNTPFLSKYHARDHQAYE